jgi:RNA polymerase sigma factor (sigma-70 family)
MNDGELLREFQERGRDPAFEELTRRHLNGVYSTALRRVGDPHAAADVSQTVFCLLVRKARQLLGAADLTGWLHRATCWKAAEHLRAERRRRFHEHTAATMNDHDAAVPDPWAELVPHLDETLNRLSEPDRQLILLRYYRRLSWREIGALLRLNEDAARMRLQRALERLRRKLVGVVPALSGVLLLEELLQASAVVAAPATLAARVAAAARRAGRPAAGEGGRDSLWAGRVSFPKAAWAALALLVAVPLGWWSYDWLTRPKDASAAGSVSLASTPQGLAYSAAQARVQLATTRPAPGEPGLEERLAALRRILRSTIQDEIWPPQDLRECIQGLVTDPEAVFALLSETLRAPGAGPTTRERTVWGLWLLGQAAPGTLGRTVPLLVEVLRSPDERELWWHASSVLQHLGVPAGSVRAVADAVVANPAAGFATLRFWTTAARREPDEVAETARPWLRLGDPLRFCAACILARVPAGEQDGVAGILVEATQDPGRQQHALEGLAALGAAAVGQAPLLEEMLEQANDQGQVALARQLVEVLASVAPESRSRWPEVDRHLRGKEEADAFADKSANGTAALAELMAALNQPTTAWMAALDLEAMGPAAAEALPALRAALAGPSSEHADHLARAIKAIDPESPKPRFSRDDLLGALRALSQTTSELSPSLEAVEQSALAQFENTLRSLTPAELADRARQLEAVHPQLRATWVTELLKVDPALENVLGP